MPSKKRWVSHTYKALSGSRTYVRDRVARAEQNGRGAKLAINFDIDNTALATHYARGRAVAPSLRLAKYARNKGVYILFNTARRVSTRNKTIAELKRAGYPVDGLCAKYRGESKVQSKKRCRRSFVHNGFRLIINVGNRFTDFVGGDYTRAYRLPSYRNRLD